MLVVGCARLVVGEDFVGLLDYFEFGVCGFTLFRGDFVWVGCPCCLLCWNSCKYLCRNDPPRVDDACEPCDMPF